VIPFHWLSWQEVTAGWHWAHLMELLWLLRGAFL
jgi:hypothetical protein